MQYPEKIKAPEMLSKMLERYQLHNLMDCKNAIKEIIQEIALLGLWRAKFFEKAAFYGGTALRILYQLDRFSEDLDFTLLKADPEFDIADYEKSVQEELQSLGFIAHVEKKIKSRESAIDSAFIKVNTVQHLLLINAPLNLNKNIHPDEIIKIRFEVDTHPPAMDVIQTENRYLLLPYPFSVKTLRLEDLFAGKVHATLCREWKGRVKGRDWYDLIWFVSKGVLLNLHFLEERMRQSGYWPHSRKMTREDVLQLFEQKINELNIASAKEDIINFIKDSAYIELWSKDFFRHIVQNIKIESAS